MPPKRKERVRSADRRGGIELLLTEHIENVGDQGQIVKVKPGYARNYLLPLGLATVATEANKSMVARHRQRQDEVAVTKLKALKQIGDKIRDYSVTLEANATDEGHLYGSIGAAGDQQGPEGCQLPGRRSTWSGWRGAQGTGHVHRQAPAARRHRDRSQGVGRADGLVDPVIVAEVVMLSPNTPAD